MGNQLWPQFQNGVREKSITIGDSYEIDLVALHLLSSQLLVMCHGNRNDFYSTTRLNSCLRYLLDNECYASLAVVLTQIQQRSLSCNRRLFADE